MIYKETFFLNYSEDCALVGVSPTGLIVVDLMTELHTIRQIRTPNGMITAEGDANLPLPPDLIRPAPVSLDHPANYRGARLRGVRAQDRIDDLVLPLAMPEKMNLVRQLKLNIIPPLLLGLAESTVLSTACLPGRDLTLICRRVRLAYALSAPRTDENGVAYDYDTHTCYLVHAYAPGDDRPLSDLLSGLPGADLRHPSDVVVAGDWLVIADPALGTGNSQLHVWSLAG
jgi:hypothetical protein